MIFQIDIRTRSRTNARPDHWSGRARATREERRATRLALMCARLASRPPALPAIVTMVRIAPRQLDDDNLRGALKAIRDELAVWLGLPSDRGPRCVWQ